MEDKALNRLLKKLSAVRATLNQDERDLLDGIIASARFGVKSAEEEVTPHALEHQVTQKIQQKIANVAEMKAHSMDEQHTSKPEAAEFKLFVIQNRIKQGAEMAAEVTAHAQEMKTVTKADLGPDARVFRINLDKEAATYRVV